MAVLSQQNILLSISILISNRPDTVVKCLRSLDSLRKKVPSELILVDTGCTEQVRGMIEPYADKIVKFEWCNDFSRARNAGLRLARGEWFLYLDDDEWFEDTAEIEDFFLSDKHLYYGYGSYLVRNYFDPEGRKYRDEYVGRLVRLEPDTEFVHAIHESFSKVKGSRIRLHSYVHHYGYAFRNEEEARRHGQRNIELLLAEREKEPWEVRHNAHLAQEYNALKEWEKSIRISLEGIRNAEPGVSTEQYLGGLYVNIVRNYVNLEQYSNAVGIGEEYLELDHSNELDRAVIYYNLSIAYLELEEYVKSLEAAESYLNFYEKWKTHRDATAFYEYMAIAFMSEGCRQAAICISVQDAARLGKGTAAKKYFEEMNWDIIHNMLETQGVQGMVQAVVREWLRTEENAVQDYIAMMKALLSDRILEGLVIKEICDNFRREPASVLARAEKVGLWEAMHETHVDMGYVISGIPLYRWERAVRLLIQELEWQDIEGIQGRLQKIMDKYDIHMLCWSVLYRMRGIQRAAMGNNTEEGTENRTQIPVEYMVGKLLEYAAETEKLYRNLYREELFREMPELLPGECQVSLKLVDMNKAIEEKNFRKALSDVREALEIMPEYSDVLKYCTIWIFEKADEWNSGQENAGLEMRKLAEAVKARVRALAAQGLQAEAAEFLRQLKVLMPGDKELDTLEQEISRRTE